MSYVYPKTERTKTKAARCLFFLMSFPFLYIFNSLHLLLLFTFCQVCLSVKGTAEIETGITEKFSWDQANIRQKLGLVWINRKKISQIIKDYFYLPFSLLIILNMRGFSRFPTNESIGRKNRFALISFGKIQFLPPCM
jgi:hypothetical protein